MSQTATAYCGVPRPSSPRHKKFPHWNADGSTAFPCAAAGHDLPHVELPAAPGFSSFPSALPPSPPGAQASFCSFQSTSTTECNPGTTGASRASLEYVLPLSSHSSLILPSGVLAAAGSGRPLVTSLSALNRTAPVLLHAYGEREEESPRIEEIPSEETEPEEAGKLEKRTEGEGVGAHGCMRENVASLRGSRQAGGGTRTRDRESCSPEGMESEDAHSAAGGEQEKEEWQRGAERRSGTQSSLSLLSRASSSSLSPRKLRSQLVPASASSLSAHRRQAPWTAVRQAYPNVRVDPGKHAASTGSSSSLPQGTSPPRTPRALLNFLRQTSAPLAAGFPPPKTDRVASRRRIGTRLTSRLLSPAEVSRKLLEQFPGPPPVAVPGEPDCRGRSDETGKKPNKVDVTGLWEKSPTQPFLSLSKGDSEKPLPKRHTTLSLASTRATRLSSSSSRLLSRFTLASLSTRRHETEKRRTVSGTLPPVRSQSDPQAASAAGQLPSASEPREPSAAYTYSPAFSRLLSRAPSLKRRSSFPRSAAAAESPAAGQRPSNERERRTLPVLSKRSVSAASRLSGARRGFEATKKREQKKDDGPLAGLWRLLSFASENGGRDVSGADAPDRETDTDEEAVDAWGVALERVNAGELRRSRPAPPARALKSRPSLKDREARGAANRPSQAFTGAAVSARTLDGIHAKQSNDGELTRARSAPPVQQAASTGDVARFPGRAGEQERTQSLPTVKEDSSPEASLPHAGGDPRTARQSLSVSEDERCLHSTCSSLPRATGVPPLLLSIERLSPAFSPPRSEPAGGASLGLEAVHAQLGEETEENRAQETRPGSAAFSAQRRGVELSPPHAALPQTGLKMDRGLSALSRSRESLLSLEEESRMSDDGVSAAPARLSPREGEQARSSEERRIIHSAFLSKDSAGGTSSTLSSFLSMTTAPRVSERRSSACSTIPVGALEGRRRRLASPRDFPPPTFERILFGLPSEGEEQGEGEEEETEKESEGEEEENDEDRAREAREGEAQEARERSRREEARRSAGLRGRSGKAQRDDERAKLGRQREKTSERVERRKAESAEETAEAGNSLVVPALSILPAFFSAILASSDDANGAPIAWDDAADTEETPREKATGSKERSGQAKGGAFCQAPQKPPSVSSSASPDAKARARRRKQERSSRARSRGADLSGVHRPLNLRHLRDLPSHASLSPEEKFRDLVQRPRARRSAPSRDDVESASDCAFEKHVSCSSWRRSLRREDAALVSSQTRCGPACQGWAREEREGGAGRFSAARRLRTRKSCLSLSEEGESGSWGRCARREKEAKRTGRRRDTRGRQAASARRMRRRREEGLSRYDSLPSRVAFQSPYTGREAEDGRGKAFAGPRRVWRRRESEREEREDWFREMRVRRRELRGQEMAFGPLMGRSRAFSRHTRFSASEVDASDASWIERRGKWREDSLPASPREAFLSERRRLRPPVKSRTKEAWARHAMHAERFARPTRPPSPSEVSLSSSCSLAASQFASSSDFVSDFEEQARGRTFACRRDTSAKRERSRSSDYLPPHSLYIPPLRPFPSETQNGPEARLSRVDSLRLPDSFRSAVPRGKFAACSDDEDDGARSVRKDRDHLASLFELPFASSPARRRLQNIINRRALFKLCDEPTGSSQEKDAPRLGSAVSTPRSDVGGQDAGLHAPPGKTKKIEVPQVLLEQLEDPKAPEPQEEVERKNAAPTPFSSSSARSHLSPSASCRSSSHRSSSPSSHRSSSLSSHRSSSPSSHRSSSPSSHRSSHRSSSLSSHRSSSPSSHRSSSPSSHRSSHRSSSLSSHRSSSPSSHHSSSLSSPSSASSAVSNSREEKGAKHAKDRKRGRGEEAAGRAERTRRGGKRGDARKRSASAHSRSSPLSRQPSRDHRREKKEKRAREQFSDQTQEWQRPSNVPQLPIEKALHGQEEKRVLGRRSRAASVVTKPETGGDAAEARGSISEEKQRAPPSREEGKPRKEKKEERKGTPKERSITAKKAPHERHRKKKHPTTHRSRRKAHCSSLSPSSSPSSSSSSSSSSVSSSPSPSAPVRGKSTRHFASRGERRGKAAGIRRVSSSSTASSSSSRLSSHERGRLQSRRARREARQGDKESRGRRHSSRLSDPELPSEDELVGAVRRLLDQVTDRRRREPESESAAPFELSSLHAVRAALRRRQQDLETERRELREICEGARNSQRGAKCPGKNTRRDKAEAGASFRESPLCSERDARKKGARLSQKNALLFVKLKSPGRDKSSSREGPTDVPHSCRLQKKPSFPHAPFVSTRLLSALDERHPKPAEKRETPRVSGPQKHHDASSSDEDIPSAFNIVWQ
uniref:Uncharacterized protein n=1 Tax=Neospora caninum (strain Liverpool) TaxID=572307 RepID=A0A0F7U6G1_NEOCL|nr:TPA: hypothetical protein BN1204_005720 [Neospora caninum Liverpool]